MDDAKENNVVIAAPGKPSWPLPSPSTGGSGEGGGGGVANRKRPSSAAATVVAAAAAAEDETIPTSSRRAVDVLAHMATTAAVRDLAAALEQLAVPGTAEEARRAAERALDASSSADERVLTQDEAHVTLRVLEDANAGRAIEVPAVALPCCCRSSDDDDDDETSPPPPAPPSEFGAAALSALLSVLFPEFAPAADSDTADADTAASPPGPLPSSRAPPTLLQLVCSASMRRAEAALEALVSLLSSPPLLSPATALSLLHLATAGNDNGSSSSSSRRRAATAALLCPPAPPATPVPRLAAAARAVAVSSFAACAQEDHRGLRSLTFEALLSVMEDDALAASEEEAFCAAALWASSSPSFTSNPTFSSLEDLEDSPASRLRAAAFPALLARGVRLSTMPREALFRLDGHPAVRGSRAATRAVARALVSSFHCPRVPTELERRQMFIVAVASRGERGGEGVGGGGGEEDERVEGGGEEEGEQRAVPREVVGIGVHAVSRATATAAAAAAAAVAAAEAATGFEPARAAAAAAATEVEYDDDENDDSDDSDSEAAPSEMVLLPPSPSVVAPASEDAPDALTAAETAAAAAAAAAAASSSSAFLLRRSFSGISVAEGGRGLPLPAAAVGDGSSAALALAPMPTLTGCDASPPRRTGEGANMPRPSAAAAAAGSGGRPRTRSPRKRLCLE